MPQEGQEVVALFEQKAAVTEFNKYNVKVPDDDLPEGLIWGIKKSDSAWFLDLPLQTKSPEENVVFWSEIPEEAKPEKETLPEGPQEALERVNTTL